MPKLTDAETDIELISTLVERAADLQQKCETMISIPIADPTR